MSIFEAFILGLVEGITEFLPISSTGHLVLVSTLLGIEHTEFHKSFEIAIQLGAMGAVVLLYWRSFLDVEVLKRLACAFVPTAVIGFSLYGLVKGYFLGNNELVVVMLFFGGLALILFELWHKEGPDAAGSIAAVSWRQAALVGLFQSMALVPGVSRSAATILGGLLLGLKRKTIVEFSFLLAVPTMAAATGLDLFKTAASFSAQEFGLLAVGALTAFAVALGAITLLLRYIETHTFLSFGVYRILISILFLLFVL